MSEAAEVPQAPVGPRVKVSQKGIPPKVEKPEPQVIQPFKWDSVSDKAFDFRLNVISSSEPEFEEDELPKA